MNEVVDVDEKLLVLADLHLNDRNEVKLQLLNH